MLKAIQTVNMTDQYKSNLKCNDENEQSLPSSVIT